MTYGRIFVQICCAPMLLASSIAFAEPAKFSEKLADWHRINTAKIASVTSDAEAPLSLITSTSVGQSIIRELVLLKGQAMLGTPYVYGSNEANAVDCSALIQQLFDNAGIELPRTTRDLVHVGSAVSRHALRPGDLLFYRWQRHGLHAVIYLGNGMAIHASPSERGVVITELNKTWNKRFVAARRIVQEKTI